MSTRQTFAYEITARARRIGWPVTLVSNGAWKITAPEYTDPETAETQPMRAIQVHLTSSDVNAERTIMRDLNKHGFDKAELEWQQKDEKERLTKLQKVAEANQKDLDRAQQHADSVARAAGQSRVDWNILLNPYPVPKTFERVLITPELAEELLKLNTNNRPLRPKETDVWADVIRKGDWKYTHQGVALDVDAVLQDGQHRLSGIALSGVPCEMQVSIGMPKENFSAIDNGLRRTFGDVVQHYGLPNRNRVGTAARIVLLYNDWPTRSFNTKVSNSEVATFITKQFDEKRTVGDVIVEASYKAQTLGKGSRLNVSAATAGIFKLWELVGEGNEKVREFIKGMTDGLEMTETDPRWVLRRYLISGQNRTTVHHLALFIKAWNKFVVGAETKAISMRKTEDIPMVMVPEE